MSPRLKRPLLLVVWIVPIAVILLVLAYGMLRKLPAPSGTVVLAGAGGALVVVLALAVAVVAFTNAAALIPAAPGYVGTYDAAVIFAVNAVSTVAKRSVLSYLVLLRFVLFLPITLVGVLLLIARYGGLARVRAARAAAASAT